MLAIYKDSYERMIEKKKESSRLSFQLRRNKKNSNNKQNYFFSLKNKLINNIFIINKYTYF